MADRWPLARLVAAEIARSARARLRAPRLRVAVPERLIFAPQDLRTADPTIAADIYAGYWVFAGRALATGGRSPFDFDPPSATWGEALYGFGWLRHLRAADTALARANARALVEDYLSRRVRARRLARATPVVARRLISCLSQSPLLLDGADHDFYVRFLKAIAAAVGQLEREAVVAVLPLHRLKAAVALCFAGLCCEGYEGTLRRGTRALSRELDRQILADGGHVSRNPSAMVDLLLDLLPLRQLFHSRGIAPPEALVRGVDRMLPMVRLFRHPDGSLSHFNGMGVTEADHLATLFFYDDARAAAIQHAPHAGYERLEAGGLVLVAEVGDTPPALHSSGAHAGCLSFELSVGAQRLVVNCGAPRGAQEGAAQAARATAAHSTACVGGVSSVDLLEPEGWWGRRLVARRLLARLGPVALRGVASARAERMEDAGALSLVARHDGYAARFGLVHERRLALARSGDRIEGEDALLAAGEGPGGGVSAETALLRFHLAPGVRASRVKGGRLILLVLPSREAWQFEAEGADPRVEESVFYAATEGARRTEQIVVSVDARAGARLGWRFERLTQAPTG